MIERGNHSSDVVPKDTDPHPLPLSLRTLYRHYIDYAGWAPPSKNPLDLAVSNFKEYVGEGSPTAWAMRSLVLTDTHLDQLEPEVLAGLPLNIVLTATDLRAAQATIKNLVALSEQGLYIKSIDVKIQGAHEIDAFLGELPPHILPFFEIPLSQTLIAQVAPEPTKFGLKGRLSGTIKAPPSAVAAFLAWEGPKKATSGIHYPFTGINPNSGRHDYGNANVSVAAVAARMNGISLSDIESILKEENPQKFLFSDQGIYFYGDSMFEHASLEDIEEMRANSLHSIGTCSALRIMQGVQFAAL